MRRENEQGFWHAEGKVIYFSLSKSFYNAAKSIIMFSL